MKRLAIKEFLSSSKGMLLLDVRSPAEYAHAHLPGAINLPLFSNEERKIVGTAYKQESRQQAIKIGLDFFGTKMRGMVEEVERLVVQSQEFKVQSQEFKVQSQEFKIQSQLEIDNANEKNQKETSTNNNDTANFEFSTLKSELKNNVQYTTNNSIFLYCWRGGMRSGGVAWLLNLYGFNVTVLAGGYKAFRRRCLEILQQPYELKILGGYTGSGKTKVLEELKSRGEKIIDLEELARHKGSAFGRIGDGIQPSQEMFENLLSCQLLSLSEVHEKEIGNRQTAIHPVFTDVDALGTAGKHSLLTTHHSPIWIEDESQRIGQVNIPNTFWNNMRQSPVYFLDIPFDERLNYITTEYGSINPTILIEATQRITKRLGGLETKNTITFIEEGNIRGAFSILLRYYDKLYHKGLLNRQNLPTLLQKIECHTVTAANAHALLKQYQTV